MRTPPFCPNPGCRLHHIHRSHNHRALGSRHTGEAWFARKGFYTCRLRGRVQRYRCRVCGTGFSEQTFSIDYFAKRKVSYSRVEEMICATASLRDIARILRISLGTMTEAQKKRRGELEALYRPPTGSSARIWPTMCVRQSALLAT